MFYYLDGTVAEILPYLAVIDCGGVGYACKTTNTTLAQLKKGQRGKLYTYLDVGENAFGLYGFATANELNSFKLLIGVSGVGPKAALAILSAATPESLAMAIVTGDEKSLTAAPGVGKKIAQRIILELKDKMARESAATGLDFSGGALLNKGQQRHGLPEKERRQRNRSGAVFALCLCAVFGLAWLAVHLFQAG